MEKVAGAAALAAAAAGAVDLAELFDVEITHWKSSHSLATYGVAPIA
jgi:hypothetical protein